MLSGQFVTLEWSGRPRRAGTTADSIVTNWLLDETNWRLDVVQRRATPSRRAASATAAATVGPTRGSNGDGMIMSSRASSATIAASAWAAASFMPSVIAEARTSKAPRKIPGNASTLLIWLGKSDRPVATMRAYLWARVGCTSGVGFARPKMIGSGAMDATTSSGTLPPETPM